MTAILDFLKSDAAILSLLAVLLAVLVALAIFVIRLPERVRLSRDLKELSREIALAENVARLGYWNRRLDTDALSWSAGMYEVFGEDPKTFVPTLSTVRSRIFPEDLPLVERLTNAELTDGKGGDAEIRIRCDNGLVKDVLLATRYQYDRSGKFIGFFGIANDITSRKTAERNVAEREEQLQTAITAMGAAIWDWDIETDRLFAGSRFADILGLEPSAFKPTMAQHNELCHPEDLPDVVHAFRNHAATGEPYGVEYRMRHSSGRYVWIHSRGRIVTFDGDKPVRAIGSFVEVTERRAATERLRQNQESLELAINVAQAGYFDVDEVTSEVYWSPRVREIFGVEDPSFAPNLGTLSTYLHEDDLPEFLAELEAFRVRGTALDMEVRGRHTKGHMIWLHFRMAGQFDVTGHRTRTIGFLRDISARRLAQQSVADSEQKYRSLIDNSIQGLLVHRQFRPLFCNQVYARLLGYDDVNQILSLDSILIHSSGVTWEKSEELWESLISGEMDGVVVEQEILSRTGAKRCLETVGRAIKWEGEPAVQVIAVDITERKRAERELRASEGRFRLLADNVSDFITLYDEDLVYRYISPSFERATGYTPDELIGRSIFDLNASFDGVLSEERKNIALEGMGQVLWQMRCKNGKLIWVESNSSKVESPTGATGMAIVSSSRDVTERVERETELAAVRDRLKEQTEELSVLAQNLEMAREKAEQANEAKSQFLAMMSHELRTPMTGVLGMADLLLMSGLNTQQEELTRVLTRSARSLLELLNDILDFSKIEAGHLQIEATPFDVSDVVEDTVSLFSSAASTKGVIVKANLPKTFQDAVVGDPNRLRQVLSNLIGNAVKFTEKGSITVSHTQEERRDKSLKLSFSVADTGIGMDADQAASLFQPFKQADISTSRKYGGSGLGLAICKRLVEAMGGSIDISGRVGKGTTVRFSVNVTPDHGGGQKQKRSRTRKNLTQSVEVAHKILVAEDNETNRLLISTMLTRIGYVVDVVENGALAVEALRNKPYDIVLMDMQMPVMDGMEATKTIRNSKSPYSNVPVIALTADVVVDHQQTYFDAGVNAIVGKPVNWDDLVHEINRQVSPGAEGDAVSAVSVMPATNSSKRSSQSTPNAELDEGVLHILEESIGADVLSVMLGTFSENMQQYYADLEEAMMAEDLIAAQRTGHALKGLCAQFGAPRVTALAKFIEMEAATVDDIKQIMPDVRFEIAAVERALSARAGSNSLDAAKA